MKHSLRGRMFRALGLWVLFAWSCSLGAMYIYSTNSQMSSWDDKLQSVTIKLLQTMPANLATDGAGFRETLQLRPGVLASRRLSLLHT